MNPTQSADGTPHIAYFDPDTQLSFVWSGSADANVEVSHGGYGEAVIAVFRPPYLISVRGFKHVCDEWTQREYVKMKEGSDVAR